jgi:hypothetical protein
MPSTTLAAEVTKAKIRVLINPATSEASRKNDRKLARPMNSQSKIVHRVRLKKNDAKVGTMNKVR